MKCRICGCEDIKYVTLKASHPRKNEVGKAYDYFFCDSCGCLQEVAFPEDYSTIYDVGCGSGAFIKDLYHCGYGDLTGCDPFLSEEIVKDGVRLLKREVYDIHERKFKLITLINVFEHLEEPERVMKKLSELVEEDGYIVILLPVINSYLWDEFGTSIWNLSPPEHLYLHTHQSMILLAERAGLKLRKWYTECSSILQADKRNMDDNQEEKNNARNIVNSAWCAISTKQYRQRIDEEKLGNQAVFVFEKVS